MSDTIDFSKIPLPDIIEELSAEGIRDSIIARFVERNPTYTPPLKSDPAYMLLEEFAYEVFLQRARMNAIARAVLLPTATGTDLDNVAARFGETRLIIDDGNPGAIPPIPPTLEDDASLRTRAFLSLERLSTAGPVGAYAAHARRVPSVRDVAVEGPRVMPPGTVRVTVLARTADGTPDTDTLAAVEKILTDEDVRPLTDTVIVQGATIVPYAIDADIFTYAGPDPAVVIAESRARIEAYATAMHRLGNDITFSGVLSALHGPGVQRVELRQPVSTIVIQDHEAPFCTAITLTHKGIDQ